MPSAIRRTPLQPAGRADIRLRVARSFVEAEAMREVWQRFDWTRIDADPAFFTTVAQIRPEVVRPHIVIAERGGEPVGMLVARIEDVRLRCNIGYKTVFAPAVRSLSVVFGGVAGADDPDVARVLLTDVLRSLAEGEADVASLPALDTRSPFYSLAATELSALRRPRLIAPTMHRRLALPASYAEFLASRARKTRESTKRYEKRLAKAFPGALEMRTFSAAAEVDEIFAATDQIATKTYQHGLGVAFSDTPEQRALVELGLGQQWFRAYVLFVSGAPVAFWPGYAYGGTFFVGTPGYDPAFAAHRVGTFVLMRAIEALCADPTVSAIDFGYGDAEYKRRFATDAWHEADVLVFAPTARALAINATRNGILGAAAAGQRALGADKASRLKKAWRGRLAAGPNA
jgi:hypothetical protein